MAACSDWIHALEEKVAPATVAIWAVVLPIVSVRNFGIAMVLRRLLVGSVLGY